MSKKSWFGRFAKKHETLCPNCGLHHTECQCWQEYVESQLPLSNQGDDMYAEGSPRRWLISQQEVNEANKAAKKKGLFG